MTGCGCRQQRRIDPVIQNQRVAILRDADRLKRAGGDLAASRSVLGDRAGKTRVGVSGHQPET